MSLATPSSLVYYLWLSSCLSCKHWTLLERLARDKHSSLSRTFSNYGCKRRFLWHWALVLCMSHRTTNDNLLPCLIFAGKVVALLFLSCLYYRDRWISSNAMSMLRITEHFYESLASIVLYSMYHRHPKFFCWRSVHWNCNYYSSVTV